MKRRAFQAVAALIGALALGAIIVPYVNADPYGQRLKASLQRSLGRAVDIGKVRFSLWEGPAFVVERDGSGPGMIIHEDPSIGIEPAAYVETVVVRPSLWSLLRGRFAIGSISLEDASINLVKADDGRWNFQSFVDRSVMSATPAIHVRNGRVNFKFGDTKSIVYLTETDLDISPPGSLSGGWSVYCAAQPARTDRSGHGLGVFSLEGRWFVRPERVDLDLTFDRTGLGEWTALARGQSGAVHGTVTARLHLGGPIDNIGIQGRLTLADVHRWDLLPPSGQGWPLDVRGHLDLLHQQIELQSNSAGSQVLPLSVRFRASDYLSRPHWGAAINWNRFPVAPLMDLATHMGAAFPSGLKLSGSMDGALVYADGALQGLMGFHDAGVTIPDSPPVRFDQAYIEFGAGHARLTPAIVHTADDQAQVEADYAMDRGSFDLSIHSDSMKVRSLHAQVALAAIPWLEQVETGEWSGDLHYHYDADGQAGWTGRLDVREARVPALGLAAPVEIASARAHIDGARVILDHIDAQAGEVAFGGEYRYEPGLKHPHRVKLLIDELDAADAERLLMPTLRRSRSLFARALGRSSVPDWLASRELEGSVQIGRLTLGGVTLDNVRSQVRWNAVRVLLEGLQAKVDRGSVAGRLIVGLRGSRPSYRFDGKVKGLNWQSGKLDAEGALETSGVGGELLTNLKSEASFTGSAVDFGAMPPWKSISGTCNLAWSPRLRVTGLNLKAGDDVYTGTGSAQDDGRLVIQLSNGAREVRVVGPVARLKVEETSK